MDGNASYVMELSEEGIAHESTSSSKVGMVSLAAFILAIIFFL
jgi:hypothetical protein